MPVRESKKAEDHRPDEFNGSVPRGLPAHPRNTEDSYIRSWYRDEATQRSMEELYQKQEVWSSCTRNNVEADESCFVLNSAADW